MASDEATPSTDVLEDEFYDSCNDLNHPNSRNLSRLSICSSSFITNESYDLEDGYVSEADVEGDVADALGTYMSRLSMESFEADEEFSGDDDYNEEEAEVRRSFYSLPATPPRRAACAKEYASENEAGKEEESGPTRQRKGRKAKSGSCGVRLSEQNCSYSGESECGGVVVITRPKGGKRRLCMDLEEVKACRDLGFELEHERMVEVPGRVSWSGSLDTGGSSGGTSPIANWRISSPGK